MTSPAIPRRADIDSFFTCQNPERFKIDWRTFYGVAQDKTDAVRQRFAHELDVAYGPNPRQRLDLYLPASAAGTSVPIVLFLHGGGFREGDPTLYGYLAQPYLERGVAFASVGYRLTPETYLPETISDVEDALTWCLHNLGGRGIDAQRLVLAGHSAGAILAAHVSVRSDWLRRRGLPLDLIKAAAPISGVYDFSDPSLHQEMFNGDDQRETASPLFRISTPALPQMVVAYGEFENRPDYGVDSERLCEAVTAAGGRAQVLRLTGLDHSQTASALADESSPLFQSVLEVVERTSVPSAIQ